MANLIEATPVLKGEDATNLIKSLSNCCTPEEARRRIIWAKVQWEKICRPKKITKSPKPTI